MGQDSWHRTATTKHLRQHSQDRTAGIGKLGQETGTGQQRRQSEQYVQYSKQRTRRPKQDRKDRPARTGQLGQDRGLDNRGRTDEIGHLGQGHLDRTARTGHFGQVSLTSQPG
jgi:hypothetical protein